MLAQPDAATVFAEDAVLVCCRLRRYVTRPAVWAEGHAARSLQQHRVSCTAEQVLSADSEFADLFCWARKSGLCGGHVRPLVSACDVADGRGL